MAEPPAPNLVALIGEVGALEAAHRVRAGRVDERVAAETGSRRDEWRAEADLAAAAACGARLVTPEDPEWPVRMLHDFPAAGNPDLVAPVALWVRGPGNLALACDQAVAVVGSRAATPYGMHIAAEIGTGLGQRGHTVIGGAGLGIETAAHQGAIAVGAATIAVRPSGIDVAYPQGDAALLGRIAATGLVVSEYPPASVPSRARLLAGNRLIAALSDAVVVVVVEAGRRSSPLGVAAVAARLGRPTMAVPGPVTSVQSTGCHQLIRDGAELVTDIDDVVTQLTPPVRARVDHTVDPGGGS